MENKKCNLELLEKVIKDAKENRKCVAIALHMPNQKEDEIIVNHYNSLDTKLEYYKNTYDEDLVMRRNSKIYMTAFKLIDTDLFDTYKNK